jgi:hypothetical protein
VSAEQEPPDVIIAERELRIVKSTRHDWSVSRTIKMALGHEVTVAIYSQNSGSGWSGPFLSLPGYQTTLEDWPAIQRAVTECAAAWEVEFLGDPGVDP